MTLEDFVRRGLRAQCAVDKILEQEQEQIDRLVRVLTTEQLHDYRAAHVADMQDNEARGRVASVTFSQSRIAAIDAELVRRQSIK